jgi:hypothetical protein
MVTFHALCRTFASIFFARDPDAAFVAREIAACPGETRRRAATAAER